ncbi:MAG: AfsR/SARP family transcriptional regulator, partial [Nonomuraea sp.]|nr:AfsR/SARP family transcriptional regulator [Nonomuraea sp.]
MRIGVLGPLEVRSGDEVVEVAGARLRALLIALALEPGQVVPLTRLVYAVWGESPPSAALNAVQALVSRLRRQLPGLRVESHPAGYLLAVEPDDVDAVRFARLVAAGDTRAALELWRGPALTDVADSAYFAGWTARLTELRLTALEDLPEAAPVAELAALVADHPLRERLAAALMRSLRAAGRTAEALAVYERTRTALADELGVDPSPELRALVRAPSRTNLRPALTSF